MKLPPKYSSGMLIHHKRFGYRGVIVSVDDNFEGSDEWYDQVAKSRPPKDRPWYHVLVHRSTQETYVCEQHIEHDFCREPILHPLVDVFFDELQDGRYIRTRLLN